MDASFLPTQNPTVAYFPPGEAKWTCLSLWVFAEPIVAYAPAILAAPYLSHFSIEKTCSVQSLEAHDVNFSQYDCHFSLQLM